MYVRATFVETKNEVRCEVEGRSEVEERSQTQSGRVKGMFSTQL